MYHQSVLTEYLDECITSRHAPGFLEQRADDDVQLHAAKTRIIFPVVSGFFDDERLYRVLREVVLLVFVKGLPAITKQPAESTQR